MKRKPRDSKTKPERFLKPMDIFKLGNEDDCFGNLYDLNADECQECGDIELCSIKFSQLQLKNRTKIESTNEFKDIQEPSLLKPHDKDIVVFMKKLKKAGKGKVTIIIKASKKFDLPKDKVKKIFKNL